MPLSPAEQKELADLQAKFAASAATPAQAPAQESGMRSGARAVAQGASFGFQDEIAGGLGAMASIVDPRVTQGPGAVYRDIQQAEQGAQNQFADQSPAANIGLQVAGGLLNPMSKGLVGMNPLAAGAVAGGVTGAGAAQGTGVIDTAFGAGVGAGTGAVFGVAALTAGQLYRKMAPGVRGRMVSLAKATGLSPDQLGERLKAFGPAGTLADISENTRFAGGTVAAKLGIAMERIKAYERRSEQALGRLMQPIIKSLGDRAQGVRTEAQLRDVLKNQASPLYEQAFSQPVQMTPGLRDVLGRPSVQAAWRQAQRVGADDLGVSLDQLKSGALPSFRGWQYMTELLYDKSDSLYRAGSRKQAGLVRDLRRAILGELDAQSPAFTQARAMWASGKAAEDAMALGEKFATSSVDKVIDEVQSLDPGVLTFYRMGVGRALQAKLESAGDTADVTRALRTPAFRSKLRTAMGDDNLAFDLVNSARVEHEFQKTFNMMGRQSATAGRLAAEKQMGGSPIIGAGVDAADSGVTRTLLNMAKSLTGPREGTIQRIGELLTSQDPTQKQFALSLMREQPQIVTPAAMSRLYYLLGLQAGQAGEQ